MYFVDYFTQFDIKVHRHFETREKAFEFIESLEQRGIDYRLWFWARRK